MKIVKFGTKVKTVIGDVKAVITATCIRGDSITYEISYFHNGVATVAWLHRIEFEIDNSEKSTPGLVNYNIRNEDDSYLLLE